MYSKKFTFIYFLFKMEDESNMNNFDNIDPDINYFNDNAVHFSKYSMEDFYTSNTL